jgi:hypothetical protein
MSAGMSAVPILLSNAEADRAKLVDLAGCSNAANQIVPASCANVANLAILAIPSTLLFQLALLISLTSLIWLKLSYEHACRSDQASACFFGQTDNKLL